MSRFIPVANVGDVPEGHGRTLTAGDRAIALFRVVGEEIQVRLPG